jgi:hypothetical protein
MAGWPRNEESLRVLYRLFFAALLGISVLSAQSTFGEIRGTVSDPSGSVIADAKVNASNAATNEKFSASTDENGNYAFLNLRAGSYEIKVEKAGFKSFVSKQVILRAREIARIDAALSVGELATEVQVVEARQVVQTDLATIVDSKTTKEINNLPVNYRGAGGTNTIYSAIALAPGVQPDRGGSLSVGGSMPFQSTGTVDGVSNVNVRSNGILPEMFPSADTIDEIKVSSTSNNAEFAQAGDITVTSRSGGNAFHGSVFWYHQNGAFDARDFFANRIGAPFKVSNDYGVSGGGPIIKNRTFFFGSWESLRFRAQAITNQVVPPAAFRTGNLSSFPANSVRDPLTGTTAATQTPFANNIIPVSRISRTSTVLMNALYPLPNQPGLSIAAPNYRLTPSIQNNNDQYDIRVDHNFNTNQRVFGRYSYKDISRTSPTQLPDTLGDARGLLTAQNVVGAWNWVIRPTILNEFRFGWANQPSRSTFGPNGQAFDGVALARSAGIIGIPDNPPKGASVPNIGINGYVGTGRGRESLVLSNNFQFADNLSWQRGKHTFKFGTDLRRLRTTDITSFFTGDDLGVHSFNGQFSGNSFADFLLGYPFQTQQAITGPDVDGLTWHLGFYAQDDWKVTNRLTLNYGIRYEIHPMFYDRALTTSNFDRAFPGPGARVIIANEAARKATAPAFRASIGDTPIVIASEAGLPETLRFNDYNNIAPRFGFAWRPWGNKTVIRGGYGIFTATILGSVFYTITGIHVSDARTFPNQYVNGVPALAFPSPFGSGLGSLGVPDFRRGTQFDGQDPYTQQWNLTFERDLGWNTGFRVTYTGSRTVKMFSSPDLNQVRPNTAGFATARLSRPYPVWNIVYVRDPNVGAWFNGLTTEVTKRFSNGLYFQGSWAWTKSLSNATGSDGTGFASENGTVPTDRFNQRLDWGNVPAARRHRVLGTFTYDTPFGKWIKGNSMTSKVGRGVVGGWQLSGILLIQSGLFVTPNIGGVADPSGTNTRQRANDRPDYTGQSYGNLPGEQRNVNAFFDRSAFSIPGLSAAGTLLPNNGAIGRFGYVGPGSLVGPGMEVFSAKLQKRFNFTERVSLQLEGSATNLFNHANFDIPGLNVSAPTFGRITSTLTNVDGGGPRNLQVGLRLAF